MFRVHQKEYLQSRGFQLTAGFMAFIQEIETNKVEKIHFIKTHILKIQSSKTHEDKQILIELQNNPKARANFFRALENNTSLVELTVDNRSVKMLPETLQKVSSLKKIYCNVYNDAPNDEMLDSNTNLMLVTRLFINNSFISELEIDGSIGSTKSIFTIQHADILIAAFKQHPSIKLIRLKNIEFNFHTLKYLINCLKENKNLQVVSDFDANLVSLLEIENLDTESADEKTSTLSLNAVIELQALCVHSSKKKLTTPAALQKENITFAELKATPELADHWIKHLSSLLNNDNKVIEIDKAFKSLADKSICDAKGIAPLVPVDSPINFVLRLCLSRLEKLSTVNHATIFSFPENCAISQLRFIEFKSSEQYKIGAKCAAILVFTNKDAKFPKQYFLIKEINTISALLNLIFQHTPHQAVESTLTKASRLSSSARLNPAYWNADWESARAGAPYHYHCLNDPMLLQSIAENSSQFKKDDVVTLMDVGCGKGRSAEKIAEFFLAKGIAINFILIDSSSTQCKTAEDRFVNLHKKYGDKCKYQILAKKFEDVDLNPFSNKVNFVVSSGGILNDQVGSRTAADSKDTNSAEQCLKAFMHCLNPQGILISTGLTHPLFTKKEFISRTGGKMLRSVFRFTGSNQRFFFQPCYVLQAPVVSEKLAEVSMTAGSANTS